jgi:hypothetical protein
LTNDNVDIPLAMQDTGADSVFFRENSRSTDPFPT